MPEPRRVGPRLVAQVPPLERMRNAWEDPDFFEQYAAGKPEIKKEEPKLDFLISFHLDVHRDYVVFFIYEQAEELRSLSFTSSGGFSLKASSSPELSDRCLFVGGGTRNRDYQLCTRAMESQRAGEEYVQDILLAFSELKAKLTGCVGGAILSEKGNYTF